MSRLLTDEEIIQLITVEQKRQGVPDKYNFPDAITGNVHYDRVLIKAQDTKTHKATLKAVGEWLGSRNLGCKVCMSTAELSGIFDSILLNPDDIEALLRGEMPEEIQTEKGFTGEELKDLRHNASDDTIG